jgi:hypothetical protein
MSLLQIASKEKTAEAFLRWVELHDPLTLVIYSDGSFSLEGAASYGLAIHQDNRPILNRAVALGLLSYSMLRPEAH